MAKVAKILIADTHINSTVGLVKPVTNLDDGGTYRSSKAQRWIWRSFIDFAEWSQDITKGYKRVLHIVGDIAEKDSKGRSNQVITRNPATINRMAIETLEPLLDFVDLVYIERGTEAHSGKSSSLEEAIAQDIDIAVTDDERDTASWWHFRGVAAGVRFDIAHHISMGRLPWTERNAANKLAAITLFRYLEMGQPPPHVVIRADQHRWSDSGSNFDDLLAITLNCWTLKTSYVYRIGQENSIGEIGGAVFLCEDGDYTWHKRTYKPRATGLWKHKI